MTPHFMSGPRVRVDDVHELLEAALAQTDEVRVEVEERHAADLMDDQEWAALTQAHMLLAALVDYQIGLYDFLHHNLQAEVRTLNADLARQLDAWKIPCHA